MWLFLTNLVVNKNVKSKMKFCRQPVSQNVGPFEVLPNFFFTRKESMGDYYF